MKRITNLFTFFLVFLLATECFSQVGISNYSFSIIGVNSSKQKRFNGEFRLFANRPSEMQWEGLVFYNFEQKEYHRFSVGFGLNVSPPNSFEGNYFAFPVQLEVFPFQKFKRLSLLAELAPYGLIDDDLYLRHLWGVRYTFGSSE